MDKKSRQIIETLKSKHLENKSLGTREPYIKDGEIIGFKSVFFETI